MAPSHLNMQWLGRALRRVAGFQTRPSGKLGPMKPWTDDTATSSRSPHGSRPHRVRGASDRGTSTPAAERSTRADRIIHRAGCAPELAGRPPESAGTRSPTVSPAHCAEGRARFHASRPSRAAQARCTSMIIGERPMCPSIRLCSRSARRPQAWNGQRRRRRHAIAAATADASRPSQVATGLARRAQPTLAQSGGE